MAQKPNGWLAKIAAGLIVVLCGAAVIGSVKAASQTKVNGSRIEALRESRGETRLAQGALRDEVVALRECLDERLRDLEKQMAAANARLETIQRDLKSRSER